jgi:hypothetical protein
MVRECTAPSEYIKFLGEMPSVDVGVHILPFEADA